MITKKSILFVNGHLNVGGVERALVDLLSWIDFEKFEVDLLLLQGRGDYHDRVPQEVRILEHDTRSLEGPLLRIIAKNLVIGRLSDICYRLIQSISAKFGKRVLALLHHFIPIRRHYDVAISFRHDQCAEVVAYAVRADKKYCWWHHGEVDLSEKQIEDIRLLWESFDGIVTVSDGCKEMLSTTFRLYDNKISVIPNLIDSHYINSLAGELSPYDTSNRKKVIVSLSRLSPEKHLENVVLAAEYLVINSFKDFIWFIIGDGECGPSLSALIQSKKLDDYVVLTDKKINPYPYLKFADIFVHPSFVESQGIAILEAMSLGVPVVVTSSLGPKSFIRNGLNGILVGKGFKPIADGIRLVLEMESSRVKGIVREEQETVISLFSPQVVMGSFINLLNG